MKSFFAVSENSKSVKSINFGINRKKIENSNSASRTFMSKAMIKKLLSIKYFDDVIKMQREKHVFKDIWLLARQGV